jgi:DNA polymerase-3 subunit epsilon
LNKILFVDTETTGLISDFHGIHQIAGILVIDKKIVSEFDYKFKPINTEQVDDKALEVSGLSWSDLESRDLSSRDAYLEFNALITKHVDKYNKNDKCIIAGYNCNFDAGFMNDWYKKHGNKYFFGLFHGGAYLDGLNLALLAELKAGKKIFAPDRKLGTVGKHMGVDLQGAHDALNDIRATRDVINKLWKMVVQ